MRIIVAIVVAIATLCTNAYAEYTDSCSMYAQMLWSAADDYDSKASQFKSACDFYYGYDKDEESACGAYGYHRSSLKRAQRELDDALSNVALFCGSCDHIFRAARHATDKENGALKKEIAGLAARIKTIEAENEVLRKAAQPSDRSTRKQNDQNP
ncbi:MAG: hypothetical protein WA126_14985 [Thermodesulfovibrionales bacterium]